MSLRYINSDRLRYISHWKSLPPRSTTKHVWVRANQWCELAVSPKKHFTYLKLIKKWWRASLDANWWSAESAAGPVLKPICLWSAGANAKLRYQITSGNTGGVFDVEPEVGTIFITQTLDYEQTKRFVCVCVCAGDGWGSYIFEYLFRSYA
jgi:hypothetical protein